MSVAIREVEIDRLLRREGWSDIQINTTLAHLIACTIDPPSELKSMHIMGENSAVCKLICGKQEWCTGFQSIDKVGLIHSFVYPCRRTWTSIAASSYRATGYEARLVQLFSWHVGRAYKTLICHREIVGFHHLFLAKP